jgi:GntR family transcriptional regulator/MocR family aminotransferase
MKSATFVSLAAMALDATHDLPLHRQLYEQLRAAILAGRLKPGTRLPSTRAFAAELRVSRNTVVEAFDQLIAEGYIVGKRGSGTFVHQLLAEARAPTSARRANVRATPDVLSKRGAQLAQLSLTPWSAHTPIRTFRQGVPALDLFPLPTWLQLQRRAMQRVARDAFGYGDPAGYRPLREALAAYLGASRGVRCTAEQIIIVSGAQHALDLAARLLLDAGDQVWIEEPGYRGARGALLAAGAQLIPVPVDEEGLSLRAGLQKHASARLAYVTPSHQYPLGVTMSLARRLALLDWAKQTRAWILEDDYDSEYRYTGRPLAAMQGLDQDGRVIYIGTLSKVLMPALRLGYLVVPADLVEAFTNARALTDRHAPLLEQVVLSEFIAQGHFARHLRRMRAVYAERQTILRRAVERDLSAWIQLEPAASGLHLVGMLRASRNDRALAQHALRQHVELAPLSYFYLQKPIRSGIIMGYAAFSEHALREGVKRLRGALQTF